MVGEKEVIAGWDAALVTMRVGEVNAHSIGMATLAVSL
jgi:FKBP-type peptidyl-prolyl cis-trans isomerase